MTAIQEIRAAVSLGQSNTGININLIEALDFPYLSLFLTELKNVSVGNRPQ